MIKLTSPKGTTQYVAPSAIALITEAGNSSQWHGIRAYVKLFDGKTIECSETADEIALQIGKEST